VRALRRFYRRNFRRHGRFHLAVLLTIVVVTYLLVPWVVNLLDAGRGYSPVYYEPKDLTRQDWIARHPLPGPVSAPWQIAVNVALVFIVVLVWMTVIPKRFR
jgi:peptidoglycan/LPS O-acetylase OafA/YrhL